VAEEGKTRRWGVWGGAQSKDLTLFLPAGLPGRDARGPSTARRPHPPEIPTTTTRRSAQDDSVFWLSAARRMTSGTPSERDAAAVFCEPGDFTPRAIPPRLSGMIRSPLGFMLCLLAAAALAADKAEPRVGAHQNVEF
jgi:hypothetical protein